MQATVVGNRQYHMCILILQLPIVGWDLPSTTNRNRCILTHWATEYMAFCHLETGFPNAPPSLSYSWQHYGGSLNIGSISQSFFRVPPIWCNRSGLELYKLSDSKQWVSARVKYIFQFYEGNTLKSFDQLQAEFHIPRFSTSFYNSAMCYSLKQDFISCRWQSHIY